VIYDLPTTATVNGVEYEIRSDYRAILDICTALNDPELSDGERGAVVLSIFYPRVEGIPPEDQQEAVETCFRFINCGSEDSGKKSPKLMDWEQDFHLIVAPVNRVLGSEIRSLEYLHWWTFVSAYMEIGDCTFAQVVNIRDKKARGKTLDKTDREWYRRNRDLVDFKVTHTEDDQDLMREWGGKKATP
jgi:hypothetical protein